MSIEHQTAPYEADAQMAYMVKEGIADFAITEDSDLIAFGCNKLVLKMNHKGFGELFDYDAFKNETNFKDWDEKLKTLQKMDRNQFLETLIMGGCEYIQSIDRVGLKVVLKNHAKHGSCEKVVKDLKANKLFKDRVPDDYWEQVQKVKTIFKCQTVYDCREKKFVPISNEEGLEFDQKYVGAHIDPDDQ